MVRSKVAFLQSADENVLAALQLVGGLSGQGGLALPEFTVTEFQDENDLIQAVVLTSLDDEVTVEMVSRIILAAAGKYHDDPWVSFTAAQSTYKAIGLRLPQSKIENPPDHPMGSVDLNIALEQTPVPLCLLSGLDHTVKFINDGYTRLLGRSSPGQLLGLPIRKGLPEFEGQPFFTWLDQTYRTGEPFVGHEVPARHYSDRTRQVEDIYYDFVYHPVRNAKGEVIGILAQAADVTERVLDKQVREDREKKLFQQWAELDAIYRTSPLGMMLLRTSDLTILRVNPIQAAYLGAKADDLVGRRIQDFFPAQQYITDILRRVAHDRKSYTLDVTSPLPTAPAEPRKWTWSVSPVLDSVGNVESIASVVLEATPSPKLDHFLENQSEQSLK